MSRIPLIDRTTSTGPRRELLDQVHSAFNTVPNMFRAVANSPAALASMWGSFGALGGGTLPAALTEQVAVAIADRNGCDYCLSAHTALGRKAGVSADALAHAQAGHSTDARTQAALRFALDVVEQRGAIDAASVDAIRQAGFDDGAIVELLAHVALNLFTNYVNLALDVPVDFPAVALRRAA